MKTVFTLIAIVLFLAHPPIYAATMTLNPIASYPGMKYPHVISIHLDGNEQVDKNNGAYVYAVAFNILTSNGSGSWGCTSRAENTANRWCQPRLTYRPDCGGFPSADAFPRYFQSLLEGVVFDLLGSVPSGRGWFICGSLKMDFNVTVGPPVPDVSCDMMGDSLIELYGRVGGDIPAARTVVSVSCTGPADFKVSLPRSGAVPITSGDTVYLSFDDGSTSVTLDRSSGANVGLNARIDQHIDYAGSYSGSTVVTLDLL